MQVQSLGWEGLLEECMSTSSSILAQRIAWTEGPGKLQSIESHKSDMTYGLNMYTVHFENYGLQLCQFILENTYTDI